MRRKANTMLPSAQETLPGAPIEGKPIKNQTLLVQACLDGRYATADMLLSMIPAVRQRYISSPSKAKSFAVAGEIPEAK